MRSSEKLEFLNSLFSKNNIMIIAHKNPDGDTLGSAFALLKSLTDMGKNAFVACSDKVPERLKFISDGETELGVKFEPETIISVDTATQELIGDMLSDYADKVDFCIDHHHTNSGYAKKSLISPKSSSAGEFMFDLFRTAKLHIDKYIAMKLYSAVSSDTGCFKYANVTPHTHYVAGRLLNYGFNHEEINRKMFDVSSLEQLKVEAAVISGAERYKNNSITFLGLTQKMLKELDCENIEVDGLSAIARKLEGTVIGITMKETSDGINKVSLRSLDDRIDVSKIASVFGGGGHKRASGCVFSTGFKDAKKALLEEAFRVYDKIYVDEE